MADGILTPCNVARSWHWFRQVTAPCNVACGSGIVTVNSPSGSTLQCDTWLWDDMPLNSPGGSTLQCDPYIFSVHCTLCIFVFYNHCCLVRINKWMEMDSCGIMTLNLPGGSTLHCGRWLWDDIPLNTPKRPPYWNSTCCFDYDHITAVDMSFCTSLRNFIQIGPPSAEKVTSCRFSR